MKILITTGIFKPEIGGPATYVAKLSEQLLNLGHQVDVITYSDQEYPEIDQQLSYKVIRIIRQGKLSNYWRYYKKLKELNNNSRYDLIYCFDHFSAGLPTALANFRLKRPLFIRIGGDFIWERYLEQTDKLITLEQFYEKKLHLSSEGLRYRIIKWVLKRADKIIFTTKFQARIFLKYYSLQRNKLAVVQNPIDNNFVKKNNQEPTKQIIFAGRFITKNNIKNLIIAFDKITEAGFSLHLIGEGPQQQRLENFILKYQNIYLEPKLSNQELVKRLQTAYLVVFPSLTDISPNTMLDCLSLGIPFISSQEIGFDWLKDQIITFDPLKPEEIAKAINKLLDKNNYQQYLEKINQIDYQYNYQQVAEDTLALLRHE